MKGNDLMAEKYGDMPKRFTKKWWEYFWDYYNFSQGNNSGVEKQIGNFAF